MKFSLHKMIPSLLTICTICLLCVAVNAENYKALIFNRSTRAIIELPNKLKGNCEAWATACPAEESIDAEKQFVTKYSITKNALFAKDSYEPEDEQKKVKQNICKKPFHMAVVHNMMNLSVEFGYEVFYEAKKDNKYFVCIYENYHSIEQAAETTKSLIKFGLFTIANFRDRLKKTFVENFGAMWFDHNYKMELLWVPKFKLRYSFSKMILSIITYDIRRNSRWPVTGQCQDYKLGSEAYKGLVDEVDVDTLYGNQRKIFEELKIPSESCKDGAESCAIKKPCDEANTCLEKWSLIPLDQFHLLPTSPLHCSHMTTVPIWTDVAKAPLEKLDRYLYALFRVSGTALHVISGIKGQLTLNKKKRVAFSWWDTVYLDPTNKKIPAPKIIYKIVKYKEPKCNPINGRICELSAIFIVHNDPNFNPKQKLCAKDEARTKKWGWSGITDGYENFYVCPENETTLKKIYGRFSFDKPKKSIGDLDLTKLPVLKADENVYNDDITTQVNDRFMELLVREEGDLEFEDFAELSQGIDDDFETTLVPENLENQDEAIGGTGSGENKK